MAKDHLSSKLAVILHADVAGSTALVQQDEQLSHERIQDAFHRLGDTINQYSGHVIELRGDALLAEFERPSDAVAATLAFQNSHSDFLSSLDDDLKPEIRVGIAMGEVVVADNTVTGAGVILAQRVEQIADLGGLCITSTVQELLPKRLPLEFDNLGEQLLKGFNDRVRVFRVKLDAGESVPPPQSKSPVETPKVPWKHIGVMVVVVLMIVAGIIFWANTGKQLEEPTSVGHITRPLPDKPSIAVLPFTNMSDDKEQEYFSDGITENVITDLSKVSGLFVIARTSTNRYKGTALDVRQISRELDVRYLVEGSVRKASNKVRITAKLIDATTGKHLWAESYDRELKDIFAIQDDVSAKIVSSLAVTLTPDERQRVVRRHNPTDNLEAYDYYLRAQKGAYSFRSEGLSDALSLYEKASSLDPKFAAAYAGYARVAVDVWRLDVDSVLPGPVARKRAYEAAAQALSLDPNISGAYSVLGVLQMVDSRHDEAVESVKKAVSLDPNSAEAHLNLALVLTYSGRPTEAVAVLETAFRLNPRPAPGVNLLSGFILFMDRQYERALKLVEKAREAMPGNDAVHEQLAMAYAQLGRLDQARAEVNEMLKKRPWVNLAYFRHFYAYHKREQDLNDRIEALRTAGMPEWPFGYEGRVEDRLDRNAIETITFDRIWTGHSVEGVPFVKQINEDGTLAYRDPTHSLTGFATVEGNMLCQQYPAFLTGRKYCSHVYQNPEGTAEEKNEYVIVNIFRVAYFSVPK